ncbi:MAG: rhomboid family intramembrane serine protease [Paracoccaceae bacterium]
MNVNSEAGPPAIVWAMAIAFALIELLFQLGVTGLEYRYEAVTRFAFFDLYFNEFVAGRPVPFEFWISFLTYGFLHGGVLHLVMNGAIFLVLGGMLANTLGSGRFLALFLFSSAMGALAWGLMFSGDTAAHLVGASGAIFGFIGALKRWEWRYIALTGASSRRFWGTIGALILLNLLLALAGPGGVDVAWQAHFGGFIGGWLIAPLIAPGRAGPSPI